MKRPCKVFIRRNDDGVVRSFDEECEDDEDFWHWDEGNYGCDCNRSLFFQRAAGEETDFSRMADCGQTAYALWIEDPATGDRLYEDDDAPER